MQRVIISCWVERYGFISVVSLIAFLIGILKPALFKVKRADAIVVFILVLCIMLYLSTPYIKDIWFQEVLTETVEVIDIHTKHIKRNSTRVCIVNGANGEIEIRISEGFKGFELAEGKLYTIKYLKYSKELIYSEEVGAIEA